MRHGTSQDPGTIDEAPSDDPFFTVVGNAISGDYTFRTTQAAALAAGPRPVLCFPSKQAA